MKAPDFWSRPPGRAARLLWLPGFVYGALTARRMRRPGIRSSIPVICVGNVTTGGSGKTPTALALASLLIARGERPAFLTRGYGGRAGAPVLVNTAIHDAGEVGDEPLLLARVSPTVVARDRPAGARLCAAGGATVIVMDDGLQNPSLAKDLSLAVFDAESGVGNAFCLPAGPLRAPLDAQWPLIDAAVIVGAGQAGEHIAEEAAGRSKPVLRAWLKPDPDAAEGLRGQRVLAFAGIGRPEKFAQTLTACGAIVERQIGFPDHHVFTQREVARVLDEAEGSGLVPVTTEKDAMRLAGLVKREPRVTGIGVLPVRLVFEDEAVVQDLLKEVVLRRDSGAREARTRNR